MDFASTLALLRWPLETLALLAAVAPFLIVVQAWGSLPQQVPTHFGITGRPDRWGGRWQIWILPVLAPVMYCVFTFATHPQVWLAGAHPTPEPMQRAFVPLKALICLTLSYVSWMSVRVARKQAERLNNFIPLGLILLSIAPVLFTVLTEHK
jgi:hypothetical protein